MEYVINENGAIAVIIRNWMSPQTATDLLNGMIEDIPWIFEKVKMYGKEMDIPRGLFFLGDTHVRGHSYSNRKWPVVDWNEKEGVMGEIRKLRDKIDNEEDLRRIVDIPLHYDSCLANYYRNGKDSISPHSDKEALGPGNVVVAISLGVSRKFKFQVKEMNDKGKRPIIHTTINNGDLMIMAGRCQELFVHSVPKEPKIKEPRISLTFRLLTV